MVKAVRTEQANNHASAKLGGLFADLLDDASRQITTSLQSRMATNRIAPAKPAAKTVTITLAVEGADLYLPDIRINPENVVSIGESKLKVSPLNATVEVDGVALGTAPGQISSNPASPASASPERVSRLGSAPSMQSRVRPFPWPFR